MLKTQIQSKASELLRFQMQHEEAVKRESEILATHESKLFNVNTIHTQHMHTHTQ